MIRNLLFFSLAAATLSSCIIAPKNLVPDMPHNAGWRQRAQQEALAARTRQPAAQQPTALTAAQASAQPAAQAATPPATQPASPAATPKAMIPTPVAVTPKPATPAGSSTAKKTGSHITQTTATGTTPAISHTPTPAQPVAVAPTPVPVVPQPVAIAPTTPAPAPAQAPENKSTAGADSNENIPYAVRVPGDPTRVYNPLAPDLTIRTIDRTTGQPLPKNTVISVKGQKFRVP